MVSAPATYWMSVQATPASARASPAAASPYSTKLRPHLPQGCMPAPSTAMRLSSGTDPPAPGRRPGAVHRAPLPHQVLVLVVLVEGVEHQLDLGPHGQGVDVDPGHHLAHDHHLLGGQLDCGDGERG